MSVPATDSPMERAEKSLNPTSILHQWANPFPRRGSRRGDLSQRQREREWVAASAASVGSGIEGSPFLFPPPPPPAFQCLLLSELPPAKGKKEGGKGGKGRRRRRTFESVPKKRKEEGDVGGASFFFFFRPRV